MRRFALITNIITPYRIPVFNSLASIKDLDFKVFFLAETEKNRKWNIYKKEINFDYKILKNFCFFIQSKEMPIYFNWGLWKELKDFKPNAICMCGYHYLASIEALIYSKLMRIPVSLWAGSHLLSGFIKNKLTDLYKRTVISKFDSYITYGTAAREQIIHYGANSDKISVGCNTVDIEWFIKESENLKEDEVKELKSKYATKTILYVGNFVEHKGILNLIKAFQNLNINDDVGLILIGAGPDKEKYLNYIKKKNIKNIYFEGFIQKKDIVKYYKMADVFVLPSFNEVWGLVINEAMACGLPVLSSKYAGATRDLVKDGINGCDFDPDNITELSKKLKELLLNEDKRVEMGNKSLDIIKDKTPQKYAESILKAIELAKK